MPDAPSFDELVALARAEQITKRPDLQVAEGDISEMLINAAAAMADKCVEFAAQAFKETFVDGAEGDALTQLANDHWGLSRDPAVAAQGEVTFTRTGSGAVSVPAGTIVATIVDPDGQSFRFTTDSGFSFGAVDLGPYTVNVTADTAGVASNAVAGTVTRIISNLGDPTITVTNALDIAGGADEETDISLREKIRNYPDTLSKGTVAAIEYGARLVPGVATATVDVTESGIVNVYVADAVGSYSLQLLDDVRTELLDWVCGGIVYEVYGGSPVLQDVDYTLTVRPGTDVGALDSTIRSNIEQWFNSLKLGDDLTISALHTVITNTDPANITKVVINTPSADINAAGNQLLRAGNITRST